MRTCRVYSLSRLDFFLLGRSPLRFSRDFIYCSSFPTEYCNLNHYLTTHPVPQWLCPSSAARQSSHPSRNAPKIEIITMWVSQSFWGAADVGTATSGLRCESPAQSDPFPRDIQVPPLLMKSLAASQPRICSLTLLKCRAPYFPQLGVKLSSLCTSAHG